VDEMHAAIAAFLRSQRPAAATATPETSMRQQRVFACRFCAARVWEGEHGETFHFEELWEAVSCAACHRGRLRQEAKAGGAGGLLRQAWHQASGVAPRCRKCSAVIRDGGATGYDVEELRAARVCADCYTPF
jgi:uncharacterized protein with PIN domain